VRGRLAAIDVPKLLEPNWFQQRRAQRLVLTCVEVARGLGAALVVMRLISSLLFSVSAVDPVTYAAASLGLVVTAALASYLPSRRAAIVNPVEALRAE